jgi:hypothetical protein
MTSEALDKALTRAERALARIERVAGEATKANGADEALRGRVRDAIAELDRLISRAEA